MARYGRQLICPDVGVQAQSRLAAARVLVVGCGGLGAPCALYLAGAGIGTLGLVDHDRVELNNLHRQIIHSEPTVGLLKVDSAGAAVSRLNSTVTVLTYPVAFSTINAVALVSEFDIIVDASDNAVTRYLINDAAVVCGKPLVSGAAIGMDGQVHLSCIFFLLIFASG